jgi:hypothetical protein
MSTKCLVEPEDNGRGEILIFEIGWPIKGVVFSPLDSLQEDIAGAFDKERRLERGKCINASGWNTTNLFNQLLLSISTNKDKKKANLRLSGELYRYPAIGTSDSKKWPS